MLKAPWEMPGIWVLGELILMSGGYLGAFLVDLDDLLLAGLADFEEGGAGHVLDAGELVVHELDELVQEDEQEGLG